MKFIEQTRQCVKKWTTLYLRVDKKEVHLQKCEEPMENGMNENHVIQTRTLHHGVHGHFQTVEDQRAQAES